MAEQQFFTAAGDFLKLHLQGCQLFTSPYSFGTIKLNVPALQLEDARDVAIATILAEETEAQRELERVNYPDTPPTPGSGNLGRGLLGDGSYSYADGMRWDLLLTFGDCATRVSKRTGMLQPSVIDFAMSKCRPQEPWTLFWFGEWMKNISQSALIELQAAVNARMHAAFKNIREGARTGGRKSGERRRRESRIPAREALLAERQRLVDGGMSARDVAARLAAVYNVTPAAIRKRFTGR